MSVLEITPVAEEALPVARFRDHLRLGSGFDETSLQDPLLGSFLRAALAAIEGRCGKALLARDFEARVTRWRDGRAKPLSPAPARQLLEAWREDAEGQREDLSMEGLALRQEADRSLLVGSLGGLPSVPGGGAIYLRYRAGFADDFEALPADLAQAVLLLAAHYYEYRHETALSSGCMPFGVTALIDRYRPIRLTAGGAA